MRKKDGERTKSGCWRREDTVAMGGKKIRKGEGRGNIGGKQYRRITRK